MQIAVAALFSVATPCGGWAPCNPQRVSHCKWGSRRSALPEGKASEKMDSYIQAEVLLWAFFWSSLQVSQTLSCWP